MRFGCHLQDAVVAAGGVEALIGLLTPQTPECCVIAANTLKILALSPANKVSGGCLPGALSRTSRSSPRPLTARFVCLTCSALQAHIPQSGGLQALVGLMLDEGIAGGREAAAGALRNLATVKANKAAILEARALPCLVSLPFLSCPLVPCFSASLWEASVFVRCWKRSERTLGRRRGQG